MSDMPRDTRSRTRLLLVDDEPAVLRGLSLFITGDESREVCGTASTSREALRIAERTHPDVAVVDLSLGDENGLDLIRELRRRNAELKILVFSMHNGPSHVSAAFAAGAHGYVAKNEGTEDVPAAIDALLAGRPYLSEAMRRRLPESAQWLEADIS